MTSSLTLADISLLCVGFGILLRVKLWLKDVTYWADEQMIVLNFRDRDFWHMAGFLDMHQNAPLGWLQLEWLVGHGIGFGERTLRSVPLVFGIAALFVAWWVARRWFNALGAVIFVGLCAVGPHLVYYCAEVKPYALDVFFVLVMMLLAGRMMDTLRPRDDDGEAAVSDPEGARSAEPAEITAKPEETTRRMWVWWIFAAVAGWFSLSAVQLALPVTAVLLAIIWWRHGWPTVVRSLLPGLIWLAVFVVHFITAIRYTIGDSWLETAWAYAYAPRPYTLTSFTHWFGKLGPDIAFKPVGTGFAVIFWVVVALGVSVIARRRKDLALLVMAPLVTVLILGVLRIAPPVDRILLWIVPSLFAAFAAACQGFVTWAITQGKLLARQLDDVRWQQAARVAVATVAVGVVLATSAVFFARPMAQMAWKHPQWWQTRSDDRAAVNWMERNHKPGDLVLVAFLSRFAVSWYADAANWDAEPGKLAPVRLLHHDRPGQHCDPTELRREVQGRKRVLLFIGPPFFQNLNGIAIAQLERLGVLTATHRFGSVGAVYEFDLTKPPSTSPDVVARNRAPLARADSCVVVKPYDSPY